MSDAPPLPPPRSLFPPRPPEPVVNTDMAASIERVVMDVFARRFGAQAIPYLQARMFVALERDLVSELVNTIAKTTPAAAP